ncbi:ABC transporter permease [Myxococcus fulvus]|uniref:ABC transporter permease n=1 Tax=Myxococcus fulvus TaxID=33 RepID=UPI003B9B6350
MSQLLQDLRLSLRRLLRERAFTTVVVATLALATGATTAVFSVVYQVMLRPLPYSQPEQLVRLYQSSAQRERLGVSYPVLQAWRQDARVFEHLEGVALWDRTLTGNDAAPERVRTGRATTGLWAMLGVQPLLGRAFDEEEVTAGRDDLLLLGHGLWQRRFGGSSRVLGQSLMLDGRPHTVVGVLPASFRFAPDVEAWKPLVLEPGHEALHPGDVTLRVVGRLREGVTLDTARREMEALAEHLSREPGMTGQAPGVRLVPLHALVVEGARERLWMLAGIVALVLLVACANVANLLLVRASTREQEVSVRAALGASRWQLARQFLAESALLALLGGAAGLLLALWSMDLLRRVIPGDVLPPEQLRLQAHVLLIALGVSLTTCLLFGLAPALRVARAEARGALGVSRAGASVTGSGRLRALLVVVQVALAFVPLVGAGLMLRTLHALNDAPLGFEPRGVVATDVLLSGRAYEDDSHQRQALATLLEGVRAMPGVTSAALASTIPLWGRNGITQILRPGESEATAQTRELSTFRTASGDLVRTLGLSLKEGRELSDSDTEGSPPVVVVNETFALRHFPGERALGQRVKLTLEGEAFREVVGVVRDARHASIGEPPAAEVYLPMNQFTPLYTVLVVRSSQPLETLAPALRAHLRAVTPDLPLGAVRAMEDVVDASRGPTRVLGELLALLASLGLALSAVGLHGGIAYSVSQRTRELGIRRALGATDSRLVRMIVRQGARLALMGLGLGLVGAALLARSLSGMIQGVDTFDPVTFLTVPALLGAVALVACWLPARRAVQVPPGEALRAER